MSNRVSLGIRFDFGLTHSYAEKMGSPALTEQLSKCITTYLQPCVPGPTLEGVLSVVANHDLYPRDLAPAVWPNQAYTQFILKVDFLQTRVNEWVAESPEGQPNYKVIIQRIFTLLGKQASRNLVACVRLNRALGVIPRKSQDRMPLQPNEQLKHAIAAEEFCQSRDYAFSEVAFTGGLHYDLLLATMTRGKASRDALAAFPTQWAESLKTAHFAYELGSRMKSFKSNHTLFAAGLVMGIGKILMTAMYPKELAAKSWPGFLTECEKLKTGRWLYMEVQETKRFEVTHSELSALAVSYCKMLAPIEKAVRYYENPYYLKKIAPDLYFLSALLSLANTLCQGRTLRENQKHLIRDLGLTPQIIKEVQNKVLSK